MLNIERVCAIVVTYNRKALLRECLDALLAQKRPLDAIVVINNASTDGTREMLAADYGHLEVVNLPENSGGAGGFRAGMEWAYAKGFDWMWLMDDDVEALPEGLERLLEFAGCSDFIHGRKEPDGAEEYPWEGVWDLSLMEKRCFTKDISFAAGRDWIPVNYSTFEGALIHRRVVERVGLPDPRFFVWGDDSIYGFLAAIQTNVIYVNRIAFRKKLPANSRLNSRKIYFQFRNRFLMFEHLRAAGVPLSRPVFQVQNLLSAIYVLRRHGYMGFFERLRFIWRGFRDGMRGNYGRPAWL